MGIAAAEAVGMVARDENASTLNVCRQGRSFEGKTHGVRLAPAGPSRNLGAGSYDFGSTEEPSRMSRNPSS